MKKIKIRLICRDGKIRAYRILRKNLKKYLKVSYSKKLRRFVYRKLQLEKPKKLAKQEIRKKYKKYFLVFVKIIYTTAKKYKNFYLDALFKVIATDSNKALELVYQYLQAYFNQLTDVATARVKVVDKKTFNKTKSYIIYKHNESEDFHTIYLNTLNQELQSD